VKLSDLILAYMREVLGFMPTTHFFLKRKILGFVPDHVSEELSLNSKSWLTELEWGGTKLESTTNMHVCKESSFR
jgi:hypothetical protein